MSKRGCEHDFFCESRTDTDHGRVVMKCYKCFERLVWTEAEFAAWREEMIVKTPLLQQWDHPELVADEKEVESWFQGAPKQ
jgi:hypothetical protein